MGKKISNKGVAKNHKPLSDDFCASVIKGSAKNNDKLIENAQNKYITLYNSDKTAHISREYDTDGSKVISFRVETKEYTYFIDCKKNMFDIVVEMLNFGFAYSQIKSLVNITHKQYETYKPKDFVTINDFIFILSIVPMTLYRCNDVLHFVKQIPMIIVENPNADKLATALKISRNQAKKCLELYNSKPYSHLLTEAKLKLSEKKLKEPLVVNEKQNADLKSVSIKDDSVEIEKQEGQKEQDIVLKDVESVEVVEAIKSIESFEPIEVSESVEVSEPVESLSTMKTDEVVDSEDDIKDIEGLEESENVEQVEEINQNDVAEKEIEQEVKKKIVSMVTMDEYQVQLGFSGIPFDFELLTRELKENLTKYSFSDYIELSNRHGISNLLYPIIYLNSCYNYSVPFYPAEDKILELYYKDIGYRVVDILKEVIPNYIVRSDSEYLCRIRERKVKTPHPNLGFPIFDEDISLIKALYPKVKKAPTKYFSWLDNYDLMFYVEQEGLGKNTSKKAKKIIDIDNIDIQSYISSALRLKEVIYHSELWTTEKHEIFKEEFKKIGLGVLDIISGITEEECLEHSKKFKVFQNYTESELEKMKAIYMEDGFDAIVSAFPYRTSDALKYKVEEENWEELRNKALLEKEIERRVKEQVEIEKIQLKKEIREAVIAEKYEELKASAVLEVTPIVREEIITSFSSTVKGSILQSLKLEMPELVRKSSLKDLPNILPSKIISKLDSLIRKELNSLK